LDLEVCVHEPHPEAPRTQVARESEEPRGWLAGLGLGRVNENDGRTHVFFTRCGPDGPSLVGEPALRTRPLARGPKLDTVDVRVGRRASLQRHRIPERLVPL
jgi:hypothetical protein